MPSLDMVFLAGLLPSIVSQQFSLALWLPRLSGLLLRVVQSASASSHGPISIATSTVCKVALHTVEACSLYWWLSWSKRFRHASHL
jgi:hypothetical protein